MCCTAARSTGADRPVRWLTVFLIASALGCRASNLLDVPVPPNVTDPSEITNAQGAEGLRAGVFASFARAVGGLFDQAELSGELSDEFQAAYPDPNFEAVPSRSLNPHNSFLPTDDLYRGFQKARGMAEQAEPAIRRYEPGASAEVAEMFALAGYSILILGEDICAGVPLSKASPSGVISYGGPLPTDSLFTRAVAQFDSALAIASTDPVVGNLAAVGRARALLNLGRYADAAAAAGRVPIGFQYTTQTFESGIGQSSSWYPNMYTYGYDYGVVADRKGINGLNYVSANDPRMPTVNLGTTLVGTPWIYPLKFPPGGNPPITLADYVESRLIVAEALLAAGNVAAWADTLNTLRATAITPAMPPLTVDSTTGASPALQVDVMFRERAFWTYGTGHRLGDLRRLVRQYGRDQSAVFPTGPYINGSPTLYSIYGTNVSLPIYHVELANPKFHGCLDGNA